MQIACSRDVKKSARKRRIFAATEISRRFHYGAFAAEERDMTPLTACGV
jgi:hypothetical protein